MESKPSCSIKVSLKEYWADHIPCPNCHSKFLVDIDPLSRIASDVLCDTCPECGTLVIMHLNWGEPEPITGVIEGFTNSVKMQKRVQILLEIVEREKKKEH